MKLTAVLPLLVLSMACSRAPERAATADTVKVEKMAIAFAETEPAREVGRLPGEFVVVRISGAHRSEPVEVRQEVVERDGDEIVVRVSVDDEARLRLRVDDHPKRRGHVLGAWRLDGEEATEAPLSAFDELMAGLYMSAEANDGLVERSSHDVSLGGTEWDAVASTFSVWVGERHATMKRVVANDFHWGEIEFELRDDEDEVLFRAAVVDHGHGEKRRLPVGGQQSAAQGDGEHTDDEKNHKSLAGHD